MAEGMIHDSGGEAADGQAALSPDGQTWRRELRLLLLIAGPNIASTLAESLLSIVDYAIVSQLGPAAQAAVSSGAMVYFSVFGLMLGIMVCVTTVVSQSLGAGRLRDCSAYAWQGVWLALAFGAVGFAVWPMIPTLFEWVGHEPAVRAMEIDYTRIRFLSLGAAGASVALSHYFIGIHHPRYSAITVVGANVLNAVLSYGLVLGKWGLPAMGVAGAAVGTVIATVVRMGWLLAVMCFHPRVGQFDARRTWRMNTEKMRRLVAVGLPAGIAFVLDIGAWATFLTVVIGRFGTIHLAATATCWRFLELSFMPAVGIGSAVCTLVGRAIGEGRPRLARRRARMGTGLNMIYMGAMAAVLVFLGEPIMRLFSDNPEVIAVGVGVFVLAAVYQVFDAVAITYSHALRGAGDTRWPAVVGATQAWTLMIGGGLWIAHARPELGSMGPWAFATLFVLVIGVTLWARWRFGPWETLDVIGRSVPVVVDFEITPTEPVVAEVVLPTGGPRL